MVNQKNQSNKLLNIGITLIGVSVVISFSAFGLYLISGLIEDIARRMKEYGIPSWDALLRIFTSIFLFCILPMMIGLTFGVSLIKRQQWARRGIAIIMLITMLFWVTAMPAGETFLTHKFFLSDYLIIIVQAICVVFLLLPKVKEQFK
jgi:hypothetical protein